MATTPSQSNKVTGYINATVLDDNGIPVSLNALSLTEGDVNHRQLHSWLFADPSKTEERVATLKEQIVFTARPASRERTSLAFISDDEQPLDAPVLATGTDDIPF